MDENYSHEQGTLRAEQERLLPENEIELRVRPSQKDLDSSGLVEQLPAHPDISTPFNYTSNHREQHEVSSGAVLPGETAVNESTVPVPQSDIHPQNNVQPPGSGITPPQIREKSPEKTWRRLQRINIRDWFGELMACMVFVIIIIIIPTPFQLPIRRYAGCAILTNYKKAPARPRQVAKLLSLQGRSCLRGYPENGHCRARVFQRT
jgi:hypothetical protein